METQEYPELAKLLDVRVESQAIGKYLDTSGYVQAQWASCEDLHSRVCDCGESTLRPTSLSIEEILADYFGIDLDKAEAERRALLAKIDSEEV